MEFVEKVMDHLNSNGWEHTKPGWYEANVYTGNEKSPRAVLILYVEIIDWLSSHIDNYEKHTRWTSEKDYIKVKFRYERDYTWFNLTWV